ncbi:RDD family protein [Bdellovibrionota bacterium]
MDRLYTDFMNYDPEKTDEKLIDDLSSALLSEKPEEHLNFRPLRSGLGIHQTTDKRKSKSVEFRIKNAAQSEAITQKHKRLLERLYEGFQRFSSVCIDTFMILSLSVLFYAMTLLILVGGNLEGGILTALRVYYPLLLSSNFWIYMTTIFILVWFCYTFIFQTITGATLGKLFCGFRTVSRDGSRAGIFHILTARARVVRFASS